MSRYVAIVWAVVALLTTSAALAVGLTGGATCGAAGQTAFVPVNFTGDGAITGIQFDIDASANALTLTPSSPAKGAAFAADSVVEANLLVSGKYRVLIYSATNAALGSGLLVKIPFGIPASAGGMPMSLAFSNVVLATQSGSKITGTAPANALINMAPPLTVTAATSVCGGSTGNVASVPVTAGATYDWSIVNGTITAGAGTSSITWTAGATGPVVVSVSMTSGGTCGGSGSKSVTLSSGVVDITAPASLAAGATGVSATATDLGAGITYNWTISNGTITAGAGTRTITFSASCNNTPVILNVSAQGSGCPAIAPAKSISLVLKRGDANGDCSVGSSDVFYLLNALFASGPVSVGIGDVNGDGQVTVSDVFYLINYLFAGGPPPPV